MLTLQVKTQVNGKLITRRFRDAKTTQEAINAIQQFVLETENVNILTLKIPLDIKLVPCND